MNTTPLISLSAYTREQLKNFYYHAICAKSDLWDSEFEWRAIIVEGAKLTHPYHPQDLTGIIFGVNTTDSDFKKIDDIIRHNGFPAVQYYQAKMGTQDYTLTIRKL